MAFFILALVIAVVVLWSRVGSLLQRLEQIENTLATMRQGARIEPHSPNPSPPVATPMPAEPARPVVQETAREQQAMPPEVNVWLPPPRAAEARLAPEPVAESAFLRLVRAYFTGGNLIVRVGIIVLFFGVAFLLKYATEHAQLSIRVRLIGVAVGAAGLFALGWRLRERRRGFALALQGGAIGVLYLTLFVALRLYQLLSPEVTFALMAALGVASSLLAIRQDSLAMSFLGAAGGFLAPVLASTGQGSHVVLFTYYALLDLAIVAQAWFKAWRPLNLLAFVFTFGVGTAWGITRYDPALFASTEPFLLFYFLAFIAVAVLFAFRQAPELTHYVDGTLVFGTPLAAMALQLALVRDIPHGSAWSATGAGLIYLALAAWLHRTRRETLGLLVQSFLALGIAFLTLAVPLWLDDSWTAITWALEGAAMFWAGLRQQRWLSVASGVLLQLAAAVLYVISVGTLESPVPVANAPYMGALFLAIAGLMSARFAAQSLALSKPFGPAPASMLLAWGLAWWLYSGANELEAFLPAHWLPGALLTFCAVTALVCGQLVRPLDWPTLRVPALSILPVMIVAAWWWFARLLHPLGDGGWFAWPIAFGVLWYCLWRNEDSRHARLDARLHAMALWTLSLLASWELSWQVAQVTAADTAWAGAAWGLVPAALLAFITTSGAEKSWPTRHYLADARTWWAMGLAAMIGAWSLWQSFGSDGNVAPLPYLPLLNPLDLSVSLALLSVARWLMMLWREEGLFGAEQQRGMTGALTGVAFVWLNAVLLRTMHHWRGIPYKADALLADTAIHTALSIFWTVLALGAMLWANRSLQRVVWFCGAALMGVVLVKLFLVDLARIGTVPRIVSFLGVGELLLVIGYYSPLPRDTRLQRAR